MKKAEILTIISSVCFAGIIALYTVGYFNSFTAPDDLVVALEKVDHQKEEKVLIQEDEITPSEEVGSNEVRPCSKMESAFLQTYMTSIYENEDVGDGENNRIKDLVQNMVNSKMCFSLNHQSKFFMMKDKVIAWVKSQSREKELLYGPPGGDNFAVIVNDKYAFRHIFKSGGTTVNMWTQNEHIRNEDLGGRKMFTAVRDPIDHFLSGWTECEFRLHRSGETGEHPSFRMDLELDQRVQNWVECIKGDTKSGVDRIPCKCAAHSYPQANFLLDVDIPESIDSKLELIGDLRELRLLLGAVGFTNDGDQQSKARDSSTNPKKYPINKTLLSKETLCRICEFVILDYALFDFELPNYCVNHMQPTLNEIMEGSE